MIDLNSMSREELSRLRAEIDKALASLADRQRKAALEAARKATKEFGFELEEVIGMPLPKPRGRGRGQGVAKYRNPANPAEVWTGTGRRPNWVKAHLAAGGTLEALAI